MMSDTKIKYKNTSIGMIPIDWEIKKIKEIFDFFSTASYSRAEMDEDGEIMYLHYGDIHTKYDFHLNLDQKELPKISQEKLKKYELLKDGDIVMVDASEDYNGIGKCVEIVNANEKKLIAGLHTLLLRDKQRQLAPYYKGYTTLNRQVIKQFQRLATGTKVYSLSKTVVGSIEIPIPPFPEQLKIAQILSTWDKAIQETNDIIKALEKRNKVLGNNLLNNETWEKKKLKALFTRIIDKNSEGNQNVTTISARHGFIKQNQFFNKTVASENLSGYYLIKKDDFCYNKSYSNGYDWGVVKRLNDFEKAVVTTLYICFRLHATDQNIDFWELYFANNILDKGLSKIAHEGGRAHGLLNVTANDFFSLKIGVPTIEEQNQIAKILSTANEELQQYKQKLANLKQQKNGLMQQLLTGKIRTM